jgi:tellurite resistance protein TehA-like permease
MGATAISVLAGAQLLEMPRDSLQAAVHPVVAGLSVILWAFGTWLIPLLVIAGIWRHAVHHVPLVYELGLWSIVFPVAMYGVGSHELGRVLKVPWLVTLGRDETWGALAVWALVLLAMAWAFTASVGATSRKRRAASRLIRPRIGPPERGGAWPVPRRCRSAR